MIGRRETLASRQSYFYQSRYRKALRAIAFSLGIMFLLIFLLVYCIIFTSPLTFYGTATTGQLIPMTAER